MSYKVVVFQQKKCLSLRQLLYEADNIKHLLRQSQAGILEYYLQKYLENKP